MIYHGIKIQIDKRNSDFKDDLEMTDDNKNVLDIEVLTKLIKTVQDSINFKIHKT